MIAILSLKSVAHNIQEYSLKSIFILKYFFSKLKDLSNNMDDDDDDDDNNNMRTILPMY